MRHTSVYYGASQGVLLEQVFYLFYINNAQIDKRAREMTAPHSNRTPLGMYSGKFESVNCDSSKIV